MYIRTLVLVAAVVVTMSVEATAADARVTRYKVLDAAANAISSRINAASRRREVKPAGTYKEAVQAKQALLKIRKSGSKKKGTPAQSVYGLLSLQVKIYSRLSDELATIPAKDGDPAVTKLILKTQDGVADQLSSMLGLLPPEAKRPGQYKKTASAYRKVSKDLDRFESNVLKDLESVVSKIGDKHDFESLLKEAQSDEKLAAELAAPLEPATSGDDDQ